jgi:hypothetical protein
MTIGRPKQPVPQDKADELVAWISDGKTLREFCRKPGMPSFGTVYEWMKKDESFAERITRARDSGEDQIAQECLDIADNATNDWMERFDKDGASIGWQLNGDHVQRDKLRIETRLKLLAKWNPKKYGEKIQQELSAPGGGPIQSEHRIVFVDPPKTV